MCLRDLAAGEGWQCGSSVEVASAYLAVGVGGSCQENVLEAGGQGTLSTSTVVATLFPSVPSFHPARLIRYHAEFVRSFVPLSDFI